MTEQTTDFNQQLHILTNKIIAVFAEDNTPTQMALMAMATLGCNIVLESDMTKEGFIDAMSRTFDSIKEMRDAEQAETNPEVVQ